MTMNKKDRDIVFNKYGGRCAYCGDKLEKGWHVDELLPVRRVYNEDFSHEKRKHIRTMVKMEHPERLTLENQMPSCPSCNINKHSEPLESFRKLIENFMHHLNVINTQYKIAKRYGLVQENIKPVVFYFEKTQEEREKFTQLKDLAKFLDDVREEIGIFERPDSAKSQIMLDLLTKALNNNGVLTGIPEQEICQHDWVRLTHYKIGKNHYECSKCPKKKSV